MSMCVCTQFVVCILCPLENVTNKKYNKIQIFCLKEIIGWSFQNMPNMFYCAHLVCDMFWTFDMDEVKIKKGCSEIKPKQIILRIYV